MTPSTDQPDSALPDTAHLHCPKCGYDLSGTVEDRCSECGEPFDRKLLETWGAEGCHPLMLMGGSGAGTFTLWRKALFSPGELGRCLPPRPGLQLIGESASDARLLAGVMIPLLMCLPAAGGNLSVIPAWGLVMGVVPVVAGSYFCERFLAAALARLMRPACVLPSPVHRRRFWIAVCQSFAAYLVVHSALFYSALVLMLLCGVDNHLVVSIVWVVPVVMFLWWSLALAAAVQARGEESPGRTLVVGVIHLVGLLALLLGAAVLLIELSVCL